MSKIQIDEGYKEATPRGTLSWDYGKIKVPENISVAGLEARLKFFINVTALDADGLETAAQQALLDCLHVTVKTGKKTGVAERTPIDQETLGELLIDSWHLLERDAVGGVGVVAGLEAALAAGANILECTVPFSLANVESVKETGQLFGLGFSQLLDTSLVIKVDAEPLNSLDNNVVLTKVGVDLRVIEAEDSEGEREALIPEIRTVKGNSEDSVEGPDALTIRAEQMKPLTGAGASVIEVINVTVGDSVVAADPAEPSDIQAAYEREPTTGAVEKQLATKRTPLYVVPESPLGKLIVGKFRVKMRSHYEDLEVRIAYLPLLTHEEVYGRIKRRASYLEDDKEIHAVNSHMVENLKDNVNVEQLPYTGWTYFTEEDPRFSSLPGIRCKKGKEPYVWMPLQKLAAGGTAYRLGLADSEGAAIAVVADYGHYFPGFMTSTKGLVRGGRSKVALELQSQLANAPKLIQQRTAAMQKKAA